MSCRLCQMPSKLLLDRPDLALYRCALCGFVSAEPRYQPSPADYYAGYYHRPEPPAPTYRYDEWLLHAEARVGRGRLLEVGAGAGGFVRAALDRGWDVDATEVSTSALAKLSTLPARIFDGNVEEAHYPERCFDLVVSLEVLEHLTDPLSHLHELSRITRPGGLLLLTTPNFNGVSRRVVGYEWRVICAEHLGYFTVPTLRDALQQAGYRSADVRTRSLDTAVWARCRQASAAPTFDPQASAALRDRVEGNWALRMLRTGLNAFLGFTGLGDTLMAWAER